METKWEYSSLWTDEEVIAYSLLRRDGCHQQRCVYALEQWSTYLALLGELGWEAISIQGANETTASTWWFRRALRPSNDHLSL